MPWKRYRGISSNSCDGFRVGISRLYASYRTGKGKRQPYYSDSLGNISVPCRDCFPTAALSTNMLPGQRFFAETPSTIKALYIKGAGGRAELLRLCAFTRLYGMHWGGIEASSCRYESDLEYERKAPVPPKQERKLHEDQRKSQIVLRAGASKCVARLFLSSFVTRRSKGGIRRQRFFGFASCSH